MSFDWSKNFQWHPIELNYLKRYYSEGYSFQYMADKINELRKFKSNGESCPYRTERAVVFQLVKLGLVTKEYLDEWDKNRTDNIKKNRFKDLYQERKKVFERDGNQCIICEEKENLEFAHIIPFNKTQKNYEKEAITLCTKHHRLFDDKDFEVTKEIFDKMVSYYLDYSNDYDFKSVYCESCKKSHTWIENKRVGQKPTQITEDMTNTS
ncbi:MAG TPA: HNH endonuclease signature motif containing protein [Candidatus Paceibacterota bacterium]|nr:HNH endonuclease signature motif containing protein [Candidatus Paceibacterota bacterium]